MFAVLNRTLESNIQTLGYWYFYNKNGFEVLKAATLELPDRENKRSISRIPSGKYKVVKRFSAKYKNHFHILGVDGRSFILVHAGNYYTQTRGCILVGKNHKYDINKDGIRDVTLSVRTLNKMLSVSPDKFELIVNDAA